MRQYDWYPSVYHKNFREYMEYLGSFGDRLAVCWYDRGGQGYEKTYRQLHEDVAALRKALAACGLGRCRVAIAGENSYAWLVTFLAVTSGGGVAICVDIDQPDETVRHLISMADSSVIFASDGMMAICQAMLRGDTGITRVFSLQGEGPDSFAGLMAQGSQLPEDAPVGSDSHDTAAIMFTSGTTSNSKAVMLTHGNILNNAGGAIATVDLGDSIFTGLPFYHAYGLNCSVLCSLIKGAKLTINGDLRTMMRDLTKSGSKTVFAVPLIMEALYRGAWAGLKKAGKEQDVEKLIKLYTIGRKFGLSLGGESRRKVHDLLFGSMELVVCGGAHLNPEISRKLDALGLCVLQGYGITECSPLISVNRNRFWRYDSVGTLMPGYQIRLENGEILVKGPSVMAGYYKDPEETALALQDGWFRTGDLGRIDKDGQIYITGRIKNLIVLKNGKKISPEQIEQRIQEIPMVKETMVYGTPSGDDPDDVQPTVSIYPDPAAVEGMNRIEILAALHKEIDRINATLPDYQQIKMINIRDREFEKTSSKKPKRNVEENHR